MNRPKYVIKRPSFSSPPANPEVHRFLTPCVPGLMRGYTLSRSSWQPAKNHITDVFIRNVVLEFLLRFRGRRKYHRQSPRQAVWNRNFKIWAFISILNGRCLCAFPNLSGIHCNNRQYDIPSVDHPLSPENIRLSMSQFRRSENEFPSVS